MTLEVSNTNNTDTDFMEPFYPFLCHMLSRSLSRILMFIASAGHMIMFRMPDRFA